MIATVCLHILYTVYLIFIYMFYCNLFACLVANYPGLCIQYDVSKQPVSIHLPLTRLMAGLCLLLENFGLKWGSPQLAVDVID